MALFMLAKRMRVAPMRLVIIMSVSRVMITNDTVLCSGMSAVLKQIKNILDSHIRPLAHHNIKKNNKKETKHF